MINIMNRTYFARSFSKRKFEGFLVGKFLYMKIQYIILEEAKI